MNFIPFDRARSSVIVAAVALTAAVDTAHSSATNSLPGPWTEFVQVEGQPLPIPVQWLDGPEARIAHSLKLPQSVPTPQPFDFEKARQDAAWWKFWRPRTPKVAVQYFNHLCSTEAGQWVFKTVPNVEGLYFA